MVIDLESEHNVYPEPLSDTPLRKHLAGKAGQFIDDLVLNIENAGIYYHMGVHPDKTFLLYGPPGNGKTMCLEALNNSINYHLFLKHKAAIESGVKPKEAEKLLWIDQRTLGLFRYDIGRKGTAYINEGSKIVQNFFDQVGVYAQCGLPIMVMIDEADTLFSQRASGSSHQEDKKVLETLMKNIQWAHDTPNMYLTLLTNLPDIMDTASLRAGRIDKRYKFDNPTEEERAHGFQVGINNLNKRAGYQVIRGYNTAELAALTDKFSYADIISCTESAVKRRAKEICKERSGKILIAGYVRQDRVIKEVEMHKEQFAKTTKKKIGFR